MFNNTKPSEPGIGSTVISTNTPFENSIFKVGHIDYCYLFASIIFLVICYLYIKSTMTMPCKKKINRSSEKNKINVIIKTDVIKLDPNIFEMYLKKIKEDLILLNEFYTNNQDHQFKIDKLTIPRQQLKSYIGINGIDLDLYKANNMQYYKSAQFESARFESDSKLDNTGDKLNQCIVDLISDIDILIIMVKLSLCKVGILNLSSFDLS